MDLVFSPEVEAARQQRTPLVALESTLVAHGLPWPDNLAVANDLEHAVRARGAVPATVAIVEGRACIGLPAARLEQLAQNGAAFAKATAIDISVHIARGSSAATTVRATATLAAPAPIRVFATGGIGGVPPRGPRGGPHPPGPP